MIPCALCGTGTEAGKPCPNPRCAPPACPNCGRRPWHDKAICRDVRRDGQLVPGCGYSAQDRRVLPSERGGV